MKRTRHGKNVTRRSVNQVIYMKEILKMSYYKKLCVSKLDLTCDSIYMSPLFCHYSTAPMIRLLGTGAVWPRMQVLSARKT